MIKAAGWLFLSFIAVCSCRADDAPPTPDAPTYDLGNGLKGTPSQIAAKLNVSLEQAWAHYQDKVQQLSLKQSQLDSETAAIVKTVQQEPEYKNKLAEANAAKTQLEVYRQQEDSQDALDAGSRMNLAKAAMKDMEDAALRKDPRVMSDRDYLAQYTKEKEDADTALLKAAKWRARITSSLRSGTQLQWPVVDDEQCCLNSVKVESIQGQLLTVDSVAEEPVDGTVQKNARGDGIDLATFNMHPVQVILTLPPGTRPRAGSDLMIRGVYKIVGDPDLSNPIPVCHAERDDSGTLGTLLSTLDAVKGPPKEFIEKMDDQVDREEAKAMEEINRKSNSQP